MGNVPSDNTVSKIRDLCHQLAREHGLEGDARDELCGHFEEKLRGYINGEIKITEEDALVLVRAHFGDANKIAFEIAHENQTRADKFLSLGVNHGRLYSVLLVAIGLSTALSIPLGLLVYGLRQFGGASNSPSQIPTWVLPWHAGICAGYLALIIVAFTARRLDSVAGMRMTRFLNYALLAAPPFGTLLGIYGLWISNKQSSLRTA